MALQRLMHCGSLLSMKPAHYTVMVILFPWMLSCGGGTIIPLTLSVVPPATTLNPTPLLPFPFVQLQARLSDGTLPTGVQWTSSAACVPVNKTGQVGFNITCNGVITSQIVASVDSQTASTTVTCNYHSSASVEPGQTIDRSERSPELR